MTASQRNIRIVNPPPGGASFVHRARAKWFVHKQKAAWTDETRSAIRFFETVSRVKARLGDAYTAAYDRQATIPEMFGVPVIQPMRLLKLSTRRGPGRSAAA